MATTVTYTFELSATFLQEKKGIGRPYDKTTFSITNDMPISRTLLCEAGETTMVSPELFTGNAMIVMYIKSDQDGILVWGASGAVNNSSVKLLAGIPFIFTTGNSSSYSGGSGRMNNVAERISEISFYNPGTVDANLYITGGA